jgi:hypothetical protein
MTSRPLVLMINTRTYGYETDMKTRTLISTALLGSALAIPIAVSAQGYDSNAAATASDLFTTQHASGAIMRVNSGFVQLQSGEFVYLNDGTSIDPGQEALHPGARIDVTGWQGATPDSINADQIKVEP